MQRPISAPLTLEEHRELGAELRVTRARLRAACTLVTSIYGPNSQAAFTFQTVADDMDRLCADMQAQVTVDVPGYATQGFYL